MTRRPGRAAPAAMVWAAAAVVVAASAGAALAQPVDPVEPLGARPRSIAAPTWPVANAAAITRTIWAPGLDDGFVPQGLAWAGGSLWMSAYFSTDPKVDRGPCRLYRIDPASGATLATLDLPAECGHAGGVAALGPGRLAVVDTRRMWRVDVSGATPRVEGAVALRGELRGSFADVDPRTGWLFLGTYDADAAKARGHFVAPSVFDDAAARGWPADAAIDGAAARRSIAPPARAQGAAFGADGRLWVSASSGRFGAIHELDPADGRVLSSHDAPIGIEDLAVDDDGGLWAVGEAGSLRWRDWPQTFPLLFRLDPTRLR